MIDGRKLKSVLEEAKHHPVISQTDDIRWYKTIQPDKKYIVTLDPSTGVGNDFAAIEIFSFPQIEQVGEWISNKTKMEDQAHLLYKIVKYIAELICEDDDIDNAEVYWTYENNYGDGIRQEIIQMGGFDIFPGTLINEKNSKKKKCLLTNNKNKLSACVQLKNYIEKDKMSIYSREALRQLSYFQKNEASFAAKAGEHDDVVMAILLCCRIIDRIKAYDDDLLEDVSDDLDDYEEPFRFFCVSNTLK